MRSGMFDLLKDLDRYQGVPPYASEHYGIYQPLLGWRSHLTRQWIRRGGKVVHPRLRRIVDGRILPGPEAVLAPHRSSSWPSRCSRGEDATRGGSSSSRIWIAIF